MAHVGTITGSMVLDPSAYIAGLNRAAQHTANFQSSIQAGTAGVNAFAKASQSMAVGMSRLNGSVYASMTAFYALSRVVSSSLGVFEEYNNIIARISATADLSISSVTALSESFKKLNRELGGSRTDLMKGVYRAVQANFTTPEEFMPIGAAAMRLRTASGREINTTKSADVISVIRNSLGIKSGREGFITDMLLRGRDIGRYELTEMASALGIPITLFGNQFSAKLGPEETLRQLIAILSSATQTGLNPRTAATGMRRMVEKTTRLMKSPEGIGKNLTTALRSMGFSSILEALNQGPMAFLETISRLTGGSPEALTHMGYGSRDIMLLTSALRNNMGQTREFYGKLAPGEIGGTTDKYLDKHKQTWWYQRDRLRSAYEDSQLKLMEAMIPVLSTFANSLEVVNDLFQALAPSIKRLIGLMTIGAGFSILRNFYVRGTGGKFGAQGSDNLMKNLPVMGAGTPRTADYYPLRRVNVAKRSAQLRTVPASQMMGPTGPLFPQRYNRRATDGRFVPRGYDIRDWRGGIVPPSKMGSPVQQGGLGRRGAMYDSVSRFFGRASDNVQRFGEGYGKVKGWLKDSWLGKAGAFAFGGNEYRLNSIQKGYNERIEAANKAFVSGQAGADRGADWMRDTARQGGLNPVAASRIAAQHFNSTMDQVAKNFNKATASATRTAKWMSRLSGVMGGLSSIGNLVALAAVIQLLSDFINNLNPPKSATKSGGVIDLSKAGKLHSTGMLNPGNMWGNVRNAAALLGTNVGVFFDWLSGGERSVSEEVVAGIHERALKKGRIAKEDLSLNLLQRMGFDVVRYTIPVVGGFLNAAMFENMSTRKATLSDALERALRENFSPLEQRQLRFAGYGKMTPELQRSFEEFALSGKLGNKYEGITDKDFGQRTNIPGRNPNETGYDLQTEFLTSFLRSKDVEQKVTEVTTKRIAEMGKAAEEAGKRITFASREYTVGFEHMSKLRDKTAPNKFAVEEFWRDAKKKGAFPDMEAYNSRILDFYNNAGIMPDDYTGRGSKMFKGERPSAFIDRLLSDPSDVLFKNKTAMLGGSQDDMFNKRNALKVLEVLPMLVGANDSELSAMVQNIFGTSSAQSPFFEQAKNMFAMLDPSEFLGLIKVGEQFSAPVQKYSEALGYGTSEGYNATLPYWADKEDKNEIFVKNWEGLLKFVEEMDKKLSNIEVATQETVIAVNESGE